MCGHLVVHTNQHKPEHSAASQDPPKYFGGDDRPSQSRQQGNPLRTPPRYRSHGICFPSSPGQAQHPATKLHACCRCCSSLHCKRESYTLETTRAVQHRLGPPRRRSRRSVTIESMPPNPCFVRYFQQVVQHCFLGKVVQGSQNCVGVLKCWKT